MVFLIWFRLDFSELSIFWSSHALCVDISQFMGASYVHVHSFVTHSVAATHISSGTQFFKRLEELFESPSPSPNSFRTTLRMTLSHHDLQRTWIQILCGFCAVTDHFSRVAAKRVAWRTSLCKSWKWVVPRAAGLLICRGARETEGNSSAQTALSCCNLNILKAARKRE